MATVSVRGRGTATAQPDDVTVGLTVEALRPSASDAFAEATRLATDLVALCDELGIPSGARSTSRVSLAEHGEHTSVAHDNTAHAEARRLAAENARWRAAEYAEALGGRIGALVSVAEPGAGPPTPEPRAYSIQQDLAGMPIEAGEHEIVAEVDATFQLEQG